jgi:hypothetical protein
VDDVLGRLGAELAERDARIAELEAALAGARSPGLAGPATLRRPEAGGAVEGTEYRDGFGSGA